MCISLYCCARFSLKVSAAPFTVPTPQTLTNFSRSPFLSLSLSLPLLHNLSLPPWWRQYIDWLWWSGLQLVRPQGPCHSSVACLFQTGILFMRDLSLCRLCLFTLSQTKPGLMLPRRVISDGNLESEVWHVTQQRLHLHPSRLPFFQSSMSDARIVTWLHCLQSTKTSTHKKT